MRSATLTALVVWAVLLLCLPSDVRAQDTGAITGMVTENVSGSPLPGVNVVIEGTSQGASTDAQGEYRIEGVEPGTYTVVASFIGYGNESQEGVVVEAGGDAVADLQMQQSVSGLDEVVVVGYGTQQRRDLTGSISSIDAAGQVETQTVTNVEQLLQGRVPGLNAGVATQADGNTNLQVRGRNSIEAGTSPLIVLDGATYFGSLSDINPSDIQSIDVLKGASAAAVYGASAASGVIEVTTKTGTSPEPTINFKSSVGVAAVGQDVQPFGPDDYVEYRRTRREASNPDQPEYYYADPRNLPSEITMEEWKALGSATGDPMEIFLGRVGLAANEIQNYIDGNTIDWYDQVYRDAALRQNYNLSVSGNPEAVSYYLSLGYTDNEGQVVGDQFSTLRARANVSSDVTDWLKVGLQSQYSNRDQGTLPADISSARAVSPLGDKYEEDGTLLWNPHGDGNAQNPFLWTEQAGRRRDWRESRLFATLDAEVDLPLGLNFQVQWNNDLSNRRAYLFNPSTTPFGEPAGNAEREEHSSYRWQVNNILSWGKTFAGIHAFETTLLYNVEADNVYLTTADNSQFPLETLGYGGLDLGISPGTSVNDSRTTGTGALGRLNYRLLDRYLLTLSYRRDGYSAFGQSRPYAYFPSVAFAWRASEEAFFNVDAINNLKLRLSWGKNGNRDIGTYRALQRLNINKYISGTETVSGVESDNLANRDLQWETTTQYNAGLDFGLLDDRLSGSLDAYYMSTENLLLNRSLPEITGYANVISNLGEVVNRGVELSLNSSNMQRETFSWNSSLTFSMNRNEIKALYGDGEDDRQNNWFIGHSLSEIYDYEVLGVWQESEADQAAEYGRVPGDFRLRDVNGDGTLSPVEDKVFQGYTDPRFRLSVGNDVRFRSFTASALLTGHIGQYAAHNVHLHSGYTYGRWNQLDYPYWSPDNPINEWARLASNGDNPGFNYYDRTTFVRLQNLSLAYQLPESLSGPVQADNIRVFLNAQNVAELTSFDGSDPETHAMTPRVYTLGVNMTF